MQRIYRKGILIALFLLLTMCCWWSYRLFWGRPLQIHHFYLRSFAEYLKDDPELFTQLGFLENSLLDFHSADLTDASPDRQRKLAAFYKKNLDTLNAYDPSNFDAAQKLSYDVFKWYLTDKVEQTRFWFDDYPINSYNGIQKALIGFMTADHVIIDKKSAENYILRLSKFGAKFDGILAGLQLRQEKGLIPPRFVIEKALQDIKAFKGTPVAENILFTSFYDKLEKIDRLDAEQKKIFEKKAQEEIQKTVYGAYKKLEDYLEALAPKASQADGVWCLPDGAAYYAQRLRSYTTTDLTPEQVHEIGLREVARIQAEMQASAVKLRNPGLSGLQMLEKLKKSTEFIYPDTDSGRKQAITDFQQFIDEAWPKVTALFDIPLEKGVSACRQAQAIEASSPLVLYRHAAKEAGRPGILELNLRNMAEITKFQLRSLAWHEAVPGHHYQHEVQRGLKKLPLFRRFLHFSAYSEGWAMYAEQLVWEQGGLSEEYNLGRLQSELWRAVRLVVDTGIHYKHWTREQAVEYMTAQTGMHRDSVITEVERYIMNPGQACAYMIGLIKIRELREQARMTLGPRFDIRSFHHILLKNGALPLEVLEKQVESYIQSANRQASKG